MNHIRPYFLLIFIVFTAGCQSDTPTGNEIVFVEALGGYTGVCGDFENEQILNETPAAMNVFAASNTSVGILPSCDQLDDFTLNVRNTTAAQIDFNFTISNEERVEMTYFAAQDSISVIWYNTESNKIFAGQHD